MAGRDGGVMADLENYNLLIIIKKDIEHHSTFVILS